MKYFHYTILIFLYLISTENFAQCTLTVSLNSPSVICLGETATLTANWGSANGIASISWQWNQGVSSSATMTIAPVANTAFTLMVIDVVYPNCYKKIEFVLDVDACTGVKENEFTNNGISIYPNPSRGTFIAETRNAEEKEIVVTDVFGKIIYRVFSSGQKTVIDLSGLPDGIYQASVFSMGSLRCQKIIKSGF